MCPTAARLIARGSRGARTLPPPHHLGARVDIDERDEGAVRTQEHRVPLHDTRGNAPYTRRPSCASCASASHAPVRRLSGSFQRRARSRPRLSPRARSEGHSLVLARSLRSNGSTSAQCGILRRLQREWHTLPPPRILGAGTVLGGDIWRDTHREMRRIEGGSPKSIPNHARCAGRRWALPRHLPRGNGNGGITAARTF